MSNKETSNPLRDSMDLLVECQRIRRRYPDTADTMNLLIDLLGGPLALAFDDALPRIQTGDSA